jgi:hypothetical protein
LESKKEHYSGTWEIVRGRIEDGLEKGKITENELILLLEDIEEHGDQYIYLYGLDLGRAPRIRDRENFETLLTAVERSRALDRVAIVQNPTAEPILVSAYFTPERLKLKWVQKRSFRRPLGETINGNIATVRYQIIDTRAVDLAILDFVQHTAILCIQKIEPGVRDYRRQLREMFNRLNRFVDQEALTPLDLETLMNRMNDKSFTEIRRRRYRALDAEGGVFEVTSSAESEDIYGGGLYEVARENYTGVLAGLYANAYWLPVKGRLDRELHTIFPYKQAVNAVVFTQRCTKTERDYVLSRIESIARGQS